MPQPAPLFEIYIYSPDVEGIHLRGGKIARGGIRWSDRMDYRTEVFGLMRAQMTKNAVIVPDGAKGGFHLNRRPEDPAEVRDRGRAPVRDVHQRPARRDRQPRRRRGRPPRGRARARRRRHVPRRRRRQGHGDAVGHRQPGRGALRLLARRRVRLGRLERLRPQGARASPPAARGSRSSATSASSTWTRRSTRSPSSASATCPATCSATGCCCRTASGSSPPTTTATSSSTRTRTRTAGSPSASGCSSSPGSSWDDYDRERSPRAAACGRARRRASRCRRRCAQALGVEDEALAPTDVIRAILRAPVDVLWNGGIGTVVKASSETDADAHDRSSDAIRVDASELRCRVVAEGGNLGLTQRARIEFAADGGRVNADFIDNSAGVDCSDHEVNLKILLNVAVRPRRARRRRAATSCCARSPTTSPPTSSTSRSCRRRSSPRRSAASAGRMYAYEDLMAALEGEGLLDRDIEFLPSSEEMAERRRGGPRPRAARARGPARLRQARADRRAAALRRCPEEPFLRARCATTSRPVVERFGDLLGRAPAAPRARRDDRRQPRRRRARARRSSAASWPSSAPSPPTSSAPTSPRATSSTRTAAGRRSSGSTGRSTAARSGS